MCFDHASQKRMQLAMVTSTVSLRQTTLHTLLLPVYTNSACTSSLQVFAEYKTHCTDDELPPVALASNAPAHNAAHQLRPGAPGCGILTPCAECSGKSPAHVHTKMSISCSGRSVCDRDNPYSLLSPNVQHDCALLAAHGSALAITTRFITVDLRVSNRQVLLRKPSQHRTSNHCQH